MFVSAGHCCYSCRAFFRRTLQRMEKTEIVCRTGLGLCEVSQVSKACSACRFSQCLAVGMKSDLLQVGAIDHIKQSDLL